MNQQLKKGMHFAKTAVHSLPGKSARKVFITCAGLLLDGLTNGKHPLNATAKQSATSSTHGALAEPTTLLFTLNDLERKTVTTLFEEHTFLIAQFAFENEGKEDAAKVVIQMLAEIHEDLKNFGIYVNTAYSGPTPDACFASLMLFAKLLWANPQAAAELKKEMDKSPPKSTEGMLIHNYFLSPPILNNNSLFAKIEAEPSQNPPPLNFTLKPQ